MRNIGLKIRMGVAATAILLCYGVVMGYVVALFTSGTDLTGGGGLVLLTLITVGAVAISYRLGVKNIISGDNRSLSPDQYPELFERAEALAQRMGIRMPELRVAQMGTVNAYAIGRRKKGYVVFSQELLEALDDDEIEAVMAHEFGHLKNRDSIVQTVAVTITKMTGWVVHKFGLLVGFVSFALVKAIRRWAGQPYYPGLPPHQRARIRRGAAAIRNVVASVITLFTRSLSRQREFIADESAVRFTGKPQAMKSSLTKIQRYSTAQAQAVPAESQSDGSADNRPPETAREGVPDALCIYAEFEGWLDRLFATHPSMDKRVSRVESKFPDRQFDPADVRQTTLDGQATQRQNRQRTQHQAGQQQRQNRQHRQPNQMHTGPQQRSDRQQTRNRHDGGQQPTQGPRQPPRQDRPRQSDQSQPNPQRRTDRHDQQGRNRQQPQPDSDSSGTGDSSE